MLEISLLENWTKWDPVVDMLGSFKDNKGRGDRCLEAS